MAKKNQSEEEQEATGPEPLSVIGYSMKTFKGIKLAQVECSPEGGIRKIAGKNAAGKSSMLHGVMFVLRGSAKAGVTDPVQHGASECEGTLVLGAKDGTPRYRITRTEDTTGKTTLKLEALEASGRKVLSAPQGLINAMTQTVMMNPESFNRMSGKERKAELARVSQLDIDLDDLSKRKKIAEEDRRVANRQVRDIEGELAGMVVAGTVTEKEIDLAPLLERHRKVTDEHRTFADAKSKRVAVQNRGNALKEQLEREEASVESARKALAAAEAAVEKTRTAVEKAREEYRALKDAAPPAPTGSVEDVQAEIDNAQARNQALKKHQAVATLRTDAEKRLRAAKLAAETAQKEIDDVEAERAAALEKAKLPLPELDFTDDDVTFHGVTWTDLSRSERLRAAMAIGLAGDAQLKLVLIEDASVIDAKGLKWIDKLMKKKGAQAWCEMVDDDAAADDGTWVIADGTNGAGA